MPRGELSVTSELYLRSDSISNHIPVTYFRFTIHDSFYHLNRLNIISRTGLRSIYSENKTTNCCLISAIIDYNSENVDWHYLKYSHRGHVCNFWRAASMSHTVLYTFIFNSHAGYKFSVPSYGGSFFIFSLEVHKYFAWPPIFSLLYNMAAWTKDACVSKICYRMKIMPLSIMASFASVSQVVYSVRN